MAILLSMSSEAVMAAVGDPSGAEFRVNTYTLADQQNSTVAMNSAGDFIVVWESTIQALDYLPGIYAQRYSENGVTLGSEFLVNTIAFQENQLPSVAMNDAGTSVVVWESTDQDGNLHIYCRRFAGDGTALSNDQEVTSNPISISTFETKPVVAVDARGNFVVAWESFNDTNGDEDVYARRFNDNGIASGPDFRVNTTIDDDQGSIALAMNAAGDFVISWQSTAQDGDGEGIYAQLYDGAGSVIKSEFQVNTTTTSDQTAPAVSMNGDGFVVAWQSLGQDGDGNGIYAQRYDAIGTILGGEFQINTSTSSEQTDPSLAMNKESFVVTWESLGQDGDGKGIFAQRYDANSTPLGGEFQVNTTTVKDQSSPAVAISLNNASVITWQSYAQDKSRNGIYAQRFLGNNVASKSSGGGSFDLFLATIIILAFSIFRRSLTVNSAMHWRRRSPVHVGLRQK